MGLKLEDVDGIGKITADRMRSAGIDSIEKLISLKPDDLLKVKGIGKLTGATYIENAKRFLKKVKESEKNGFSKIELSSKAEKKEVQESIEKITIKQENLKNINKTTKKEAEILPNEVIKEVIKQEKNETSKIELSPKAEVKKEHKIAEKVIKKQENLNKITKTTKKEAKILPKEVIEKIKEQEKKEISKVEPSYKKISPSKLRGKEQFIKSKNIKNNKFREQKSMKSSVKKKKFREKRKGETISTFFSEGIMQKIRYLHFKIKQLEETMLKKNEDFSIMDLNYVLDYLKILNINYKTQSQIRIFKELDITPTFHDPIENRDIKIWDLMYECTRVLWVLARAYAKLSKKYESEKKLKSSIIAMVECSKMYKAAAYFSAACTRQEDKGISLTSENLELNSEEARIEAQSLAAINEENKNNLYLSSQIYAGLSALSTRLYYLKENEEIKKLHLKAQINFDMGKACLLKGRALLDSSITKEKDIRKLQEKANFYFFKAEEIWENILKNFTNLSNQQKSVLKKNLSIVNEYIMENDVEIIDYEEAHKIQDPEPFVAIPENLAPFIPRTIEYLTNYHPKDVNINRIKKYKNEKLEVKLKFSKKQDLIDKKAGIGRTIKELKELYNNNDIDLDKFVELLEKYSIKLETIESAIEELNNLKKKKSNGDKKPSVKKPVISI
ncbi:MAG: helix-hairpin-helix domain-containing protein [Promethearchaeota archaeon]